MLNLYDHNNHVTFIDEYHITDPYKYNTNWLSYTDYDDHYNEMNLFGENEEYFIPSHHMYVDENNYKLKASSLLSNNNKNIQSTNPKLIFSNTEEKNSIFQNQRHIESIPINLNSNEPIMGQETILDDLSSDIISMVCNERKNNYSHFNCCCKWLPPKKRLKCCCV